MEPLWHLFVDTGGTFTDALAFSPEGERLEAKVLSTGALRGFVRKQAGERAFEVSFGFALETDVLRRGIFRALDGGWEPVRVKRFVPGRSLLELDDAKGPGKGTEPLPRPGAAFEVKTDEEAPILAARILTRTPAGKPLPPVFMRLGTTLATNALLTRTGAPVALFITRGFEDLLEIGTQQRPDLFALDIEKPAPIHAETVGVSERLAADGSVIKRFDSDALRDRARALLKAGITEAAVALLHSDKNPSHERELASFLRRAGFSHVSCSSDLARSIRILPRAETAVVNAHLAPVVERYLQKITDSLAGGRLLVMTSAGGLAGRGAAKPKDLLLSGPAGGVVGAAGAGRAAGRERVIGFDMGGTSTDVARFDGDFDYVFEHSVGSAHLFAPALFIETVAAGGGSICSSDGTGLAVGPGSAGADPGPACYGEGGPLTLTDVNLLLGRLDPARFEIPVDAKPGQRALERIIEKLDKSAHGRTPYVPEEVLEGFLAVANERMADAIRRISIRRGYDPAEYALVAFGGAGAQHACAVASRLGVETVVVPPGAGILSARGLSSAVLERFAEKQVLALLDDVKERVRADLNELDREALEALADEGISREHGMIRRRIAEMRFVGQESALQVEVDPGSDLETAFTEKYEAVYGHSPNRRRVELVSLKAVASSRPPGQEAQRGHVPIDPVPSDRKPERPDTQKAWFQGRWREVDAYSRDKLLPGVQIKGPALVFEKHSATVVEPGWVLENDGAGSMVMQPLREDEKTAAAGEGCSSAHRPEAVQVELFSHRFESIAREMGEALRRTAVSTNVKERLDFSCALLDSAGKLVVNAPHIPVHLGSMGLCVRAVEKAMHLGEGDAAVTNHPAFGGSHLPDLTVIAPVHGKDAQGKDAPPLLGYVAARAHHAEIGGTRPGSMPPAASRLVEEGVVIPPTLIIRNGKACFDEVRSLLESAPWPTRALADNMADIEAAAAACHQGADALRSLATEHGADVAALYMDALEKRAERRMREALAALPDGEYRARERLDDGSPIEVFIEKAGNTAVFDFSGSAGVHAGNLNATPAIVHSVVIYVLRLLVSEELPLNEGLLRPVSIKVPEGMLNPPFAVDPAKAPAVVGGNVETSQRLADVLIKALGLSAGSQGTMNNVLFGDDSFSYYETVCGGCGAGPGFDGASAVHSHMTNTRITDPEVVEHRYPVQVERFAVRRGSGGKGRHKGGDGVVREITFLKPLSLSVLSQRRNEGPFGMAGGGPGKPGAQRLVRADGRRVELSAVDSQAVDAGDRFVLKTPGGGGFGRPPEGGSAE